MLRMSSADFLPESLLTGAVATGSATGAGAVATTGAAVSTTASAGAVTGAVTGAATMTNLGYDVEWRVINAAEYGMPQRRRRIFILGYHKSTSLYKRLKKNRSILSE